MSNINIKEMMATNFKYFGTPRTAKLDSIEIHSIGTAQDEAEVIASYMNQSSPGGIVHEICDTKKERKSVILLPENNLAWADAGYGNQHSYTIELAESDQIKYHPNSPCFDVVGSEAVLKADVFRSYNTAVVRVAELCIKWGWDPAEKLPNGLHRVYSHKEAHAKGLASNHGDPDHIWSRFGLTMDGFRKAVETEMEKQKGVCEMELPILKKGDKNRYVKNIKRIFRQKKYKNSKGKLITVNNRFDTATENMVLEFQKKAGLPQTGQMDAKTWKRLLNSY